MQVTQTVSEAKYTYWHSIIDIAAGSGLSRKEFCRMCKISLKTFIHYEGIFLRQKERGYIYHRDKGDGRTESSDDSETSTDKKICVDGADTSGNYINQAEKKVSGGDQEKADKADSAADDRSRYVEIPVVEANEDESEPQEADVAVCDHEASERTTNDDRQGRGVHAALLSDINDVEGCRSIVLDTGGCRITIGSNVCESTLLAVLKAVSANA